jgi:V/A-type H+-transporting ATPase subunit C
MAKTIDVTYTTGVIAAREKYLLKDKIYRLCELSEREAFRMLVESGFGGGAETAIDSVDYEKLIAVEEEKLDAFIREYAPSQAEASYLLSPRDFHNAKALVKAAYLGENADKMLLPDGLIAKDVLRSCVENGDFSALKDVVELKMACESATSLLQEKPSGAKVGEIFQAALYRHLQKTAKHKVVLKKLLKTKADMTNILTALRQTDEETAAEKYLPVGTLSTETLSALFNADSSAFQNTPYYDFVKLCLLAKEKGLPMTEAEKIRDGYDTAYFTERKYELKNSEPFLYYVYRRKAECINVRVVFVCLAAGLSEQEIKRRLRAM